MDPGADGVCPHRSPSMIHGIRIGNRMNDDSLFPDSDDVRRGRRIDAMGSFTGAVSFRMRPLHTSHNAEAI